MAVTGHGETVQLPPGHHPSQGGNLPEAVLIYYQPLPIALCIDISVYLVVT